MKFLNFLLYYYGKLEGKRMGIRTGEQYIEGLRKRNPEIWIEGEK